MIYEKQYFLENENIIVDIYVIRRLTVVKQINMLVVFSIIVNLFNWYI